MRFDRVTATDDVMLVPETVNESGLMLWLAQRFQGEKVELEFDTTHVDGQIEPRLWVKPPIKTDAV